MTRLGKALGRVEQAFGHIWSVGEVAVMATRPHELREDPHREGILGHIAEQGFYPDIPADSIRLATHNGYIRGQNPYQRRIANPANDRILARWKPARGASARRLVIMCHCYGVPVPPIMDRLFGLDQLHEVDIAYNIMNHHYRGSYPAWPGTGLVSGRQSQFVENIRSAVTGLRALIQHLRAQKDYDSVTVLGFSIGGQMGLHLANSAPIDNAILYCPVTSLHQTGQELGLMGTLQPLLRQWARTTRAQLHLDDLLHADPLKYPLRVKPQNLHVIVQRHDALAPPTQIAAIRRKYPACGWHEYEGTHIFPVGRAKFQRTIAQIVRS